MNATEFPLRRRAPANVQAAEPRQRSTSLGSAGTTGRFTDTGHHPARPSLAGQGSYYPDPGHIPSERGFIASSCVAWIILIGSTVPMVVFL